MNIADIFARQVAQQSANIAIDYGDTRISYNALDVLSRQVAARLKANGVGEGDLVALRLKDTPLHIAALFAVMRLGAISLPFDWRMVPVEVRRLVERFQPKAILDDAGSPVAGAIGVEGIETEQLDDARPAALSGAPLVYSLTSGTTGEPKGIIVTHEGFFARFSSRTIETQMKRDVRHLVPLPLAYMAGREHSLMPLLLGGTLVMFPTMFEPRELVETVNRRRITVVSVSPNMTRALLALPRPAKGGLLMPNLDIYMSTTGKLQPEERAALRERVAPHLFDYYGSSGAAPIAVIDNERDGRDPTVAGRIAIGMDLEVVGTDDKRLPFGEVGMVRLRGPMVTPGFFGRNLSEDEGIRDGWYYPGDIGAVDESGLLHLHGRIADLIKRGGLMVHAQEVEQVLRQHPQISDAAVVGMPSRELGEEVAAFITVKGPVEPFAVIRHCRERLAAFKVPARLAIVDALPRNNNNKVVKAELKQREAPLVEAPAEESPGRRATAPAAAAGGSLEESILGIFRHALHNPDLGPDDDFFENGGDSLIAAAMMGEITAAHGVTLSVSTILQSGTARSLAAEVAGTNVAKRASSVVKVQTAGKGIPLVVVHGLTGDVVYSRQLAVALGPVRPLYAFRGSGLQEGEGFAQSVQEMAAQYKADIDEIVPDGPVFVLGYCGGGMTAYELARQMKETGREVVALVMIDPPVGWRRGPWTWTRGKGLEFFQFAARMRYRWAQLKPIFRPMDSGNLGRFMFVRTFSRSLAHYEPKPLDLKTFVIHSRDYARDGMFHPEYGYPSLIKDVRFQECGITHDNLFDPGSPVAPAVRDFLESIDPTAKPASAEAQRVASR